MKFLFCCSVHSNELAISQAGFITPLIPGGNKEIGFIISTWHVNTVTQNSRNPKQEVLNLEDNLKGTSVVYLGNVEYEKKWV